MIFQHSAECWNVIGFQLVFNRNKKSSRKMRDDFLLSKQACKPNSVSRPEGRMVIICLGRQLLAGSGDLLVL